MNIFDRIIIRLDYISRRIYCFFKGHRETQGYIYNYEPDYCSRCGIVWPQDSIVLPRIIEDWEDKIMVFIEERIYK